MDKDKILEELEKSVTANGYLLTLIAKNIYNGRLNLDEEAEEKINSLNVEHIIRTGLIQKEKKE